MTDFKRFFLYAAVVAVVFMLWNSWQHERSLQQPTTRTVTTTIGASASPTSLAQTSSTQTGDFVPSLAPPPQTDSTAAAVSHDSVTASSPSQQLITVTTDVFEVTIDKQGGSIVKVALLDYLQEAHDQQTPFVLLNDQPTTRYVAQSGLIIPGDDSAEPRLFHSRQNQYQLQANDQVLEVMLTSEQQGIQVQKIYTFKPGDYLIQLTYQIANARNQPWRGSLYTQLTRTEPQEKSSGFLTIASFSGASLSNPDEKMYQKISFKKLRSQNVNQVVTGGWAAMQQHYFLSAFIPPESQISQYYSNHNAQNGEYTIGLVGPEVQIAPGQQQTLRSSLFVGPEITPLLKDIAPGLDLTVDYGWLWPISVFLMWLMRQVHYVVGNWGWSIIIVTGLIKLAFYYPSAKSYRSMAHMRELQPRMKMLKERYADDKAKFSQAMMELYRKEKVNPLGGCLPILIQLPVFIALYWVLLESVEFRHAPFMFWIQDLSAKDPYFILPVLMGISMFIQQKLNPPPPDPMQEKILLFLPIALTFLFVQFPAGLVLYWTVNNVLSIAQQWYVMQRFKQHKENTEKKLKIKKTN
ncbi:MAG: membrane protein insertase YidC [Legionellales bacterium]|nr:membrane protein insertase YidC [Legionellales bacterium]